MDNFKDWYGNKKGKYILFFGFYIVFFIFLGFYIKNSKIDQKEENKEEVKQEEKLTTYNITNLINNNYKYEIEVNDNNIVTNFKGSKNNVDYANYSNKYFLDIYNINQLLKKSKFIGNYNNILKYELSNSELNEILITEKKDGINKIDVSIDKTGNINKIIMDLSNYLEKDIYEISITYIIGDNNENSIS